MIHTVRKLPKVVKALQYTGCLRSHVEVLEFCDASYGDGDLDPFIETLEGNMKVPKGDWVICGAEGEFYPCKPNIFAKTYEIVS